MTLNCSNFDIFMPFAINILVCALVIMWLRMKNGKSSADGDTSFN